MRANPVVRALALLVAVLGLAALMLWWPRPAGGPTTSPDQHSGVELLAPAETAAEDWQVVGRAGQGLGEFNQPRGVTGLPDGSFIVVDRSARVQRFDPVGRALVVWTMPEHTLGNPKGLCALPDGCLLVCDTHYGRVLVMSQDGKLLKRWGGAEPGTAPGQFLHPLACAADPQAGVAYVAEYGAYNDRIQKFRLDGVLLKHWGRFGDGPGEFRRPSGVAVDRAGHVFVADACNHRVQKFDPEGRLLAVFGAMGGLPGQLRYPYDLAVDASGRVYVAEFNNHRVSVFDGEGKFLRELGGPGFEVGLFNQPWSLTVDARGRLLVSDTRNNRIQVLRVAGPAP